WGGRTPAGGAPGAGNQGGLEAEVLSDTRGDRIVHRARMNAACPRHDGAQTVAPVGPVHVSSSPLSPAPPAETRPQSNRPLIYRPRFAPVPVGRDKIDATPFWFAWGRPALRYQGFTLPVRQSHDSRPGGPRWPGAAFILPQVSPIQVPGKWIFA